MSLYDNGETQTCSRMEEEEWYPDYQTLLEISCIDEEYSVEELMKWFTDGYKDIFGIDYSNQERLLRWCVLLTERHRISLLCSHVYELKEAFEEWNENSNEFPSDRLLTAINEVIEK